ncbi:TRAP transporter small permease [Rhizobium halophytocola]|uniref:TRAP transporter small permease protein n=1 Tax=Rhizobium halophytocola TaxID=735519 RepID=A0ABS4DVF0_9HYPH|nr:TRAP transporter small permease subunit [Rhizobium halophytocola]MBP1849674.1 TRAP-type C4-dicarboxylate transport system permease small subunit [Rhizobium halophytocola]
MSFVHGLRVIERTVIVSVFLAMVALYFANVLLREFGGTLASDFAWIDAAVGVLNLYLVFLTAGLALERGRQVGINTWRDRIAARTRLPLRLIINITGFLFSLHLTWLGWQMCRFVLRLHQTNPSLNISTAWIYAAPTIGFGLLALRFLLSATGRIDRFSGPIETEAA